MTRIERQELAIRLRQLWSERRAREREALRRRLQERSWERVRRRTDSGYAWVWIV